MGRTEKRHGTYYAYWKTGCRCAPCVAWHDSIHPGRYWDRQVINEAAWTPTNLAWMAGLFEGEGSMFMSKAGQLSIVIAMTDHDIIERCVLASGTGYVNGPYADGRGPNRKPIWHWKCSSREAYALAVALFPALGVRRREQVAAACRGWIAYRRPVHWRKRVA